MMPTRLSAFCVADSTLVRPPPGTYAMFSVNPFG